MNPVTINPPAQKSIEVDISSDIPVSTKLLASVSTRVEAVLVSEYPDTTFEISVLLTGDNQIADLHKKWMDIEGATDVLSFPLLEDPSKGGHLGDVVVSLDTARQQATEHSINFASEVLLLAVHGTLHLLGYDDLDPESRSVMRLKEAFYVPESQKESQSQ